MNATLTKEQWGLEVLRQLMGAPYNWPEPDAREYLSEEHTAEFYERLFADGCTPAEAVKQDSDYWQ